MLLEKARQLKKEISSSLFSKNKRSSSRVISFAAGSRAGALTVETDIQTTVNGVGISERPDGTPIIKLFTREQLSTSLNYLSEYYGTRSGEIIVEQIGRITLKSPRSLHRPIFRGISIGHYKVTAGTLGCFVKNDKNEEFILSNNHVLANNNLGSFDDDILQPGNLDGGGSKKNRIAGLSYFVPVEPSKPNEMDAAIALIDDGISIAKELENLPRVSGTKNPANKMLVEKFGRTTGHTNGKITTLNVDLQVDFDGIFLDFIDQFEIKSQIKNGRRIKFCKDGDSGSIIMQKGTNKAVGLLFAGNSEGTTFATPINEVLKAFSVKIS